MIGHMPEIYPDELMYSWYARYFVHSGYPTYTAALEDILMKRTGRVGMEFCGKLNEESKSLFSSMYGMEYLISNHTMFSQYARFETDEKQRVGMRALVDGTGNIYNVLSFPKEKGSAAYLRYCPVCVKRDREKYGETYWHRVHQIRNITCCPEHGCRLHISNIVTTANTSPRLWPAEETVTETAVIPAKEFEIKIAKYISAVFQAPMPQNQSQLGVWLRSKLEGTSYISVRGRKLYVKRLYEELTAFFEEYPDTAIIGEYQIRKMLTGYMHFFFPVCQLAFFLGIPSDELACHTLGEKTQTERFDERVVELYEQGVGSRQIAKLTGVCPSTVRSVMKKKEKLPYDHSVRKGMHWKDWDKMDEEMIGKVRLMCEKIYGGEGGRPHRVTEGSVQHAMGWPQKRLQFLPLCRTAVHEYEESMEQYWARECVWAYQKLKEEYDSRDIRWRQLRDLTNMRRADFERCKEFISLYTDVETAEHIIRLI